jgi:ribose transport system ATP-binding protein
VSSPEPALVVRNISKTFAGGKALDSVSFEVGRGSIHALLGANGSGKSTLVKSLAGVQPADSGGFVTVGAETTSIESLTPAWARKHGLRFVHQNPGIFSDMTVADNMRMGVGFPNRFGSVSRAALNKQVTGVLEQFEVEVLPTAIMGDLRVADQTMVAIARALQRDEGEREISALVLDEPTASLPEEEVEILLAAIKRAARSGVGIIYISHRLEEVRSISDALTVLRDGREIITRSAEGITERELIAYIVGQPLSQMGAQRVSKAERGHVVAQMDGVWAGPLKDVSFDVRAGEILGIAGLLGSGRSELLKTFFGSQAVARGRVVIAGEEVELSRPIEAMNRGVALVPENRDVDASFSDLSVRENLSAATVSRFSRFGWIRGAYESAEARHSMTDFSIKAHSDSALMSSLSGGNRQKVILARWMRRHPKLLLLDEPTQGVDIGARADAYQIIRRAVDDGAATILVSSDLEELAEMSDRVLILSNGRITAEVTGDGLNRHHLTELVFMAREELK